MKIVKFLHQLISGIIKRTALSSHPQQLAAWNHLNRRKNFRIQYSHLGPLAGLPKVYLGNEELNVKNISTGGLLVIDDTSVFGMQVGQSYQLKFVWPDGITDLQTKIVGAQLVRRHIQFNEFDPVLFKRISELVKPAFLGSKFKKVHLSTDTDVIELWIGQADSSLHFSETQWGNEVSLLLEGKTYRFDRTKKWLDHKGHGLSQQNLAYIFICLTNIQNMTHALRELIENTADDYQSNYKATGDGSY